MADQCVLLEQDTKAPQVTVIEVAMETEILGQHASIEMVREVLYVPFTLP